MFLQFCIFVARFDMFVTVLVYFDGLCLDSLGLIMHDVFLIHVMHAPCGANLHAYQQPVFAGAPTWRRSVVKAGFFLNCACMLNPMDHVQCLVKGVRWTAGVTRGAFDKILGKAWCVPAWSMNMSFVVGRCFSKPSDPSHLCTHVVLAKPMHHQHACTFMHIHACNMDGPSLIISHKKACVNAFELLCILQILASSFTI